MTVCVGMARSADATTWVNLAAVGGCSTYAPSFTDFVNEGFKDTGSQYTYVVCPFAQGSAFEETSVSGIYADFNSASTSSGVEACARSYNGSYYGCSAMSYTTNQSGGWVNPSVTGSNLSPWTGDSSSTRYVYALLEVYDTDTFNGIYITQ
jgi:hypothetical protein